MTEMVTSGLMRGCWRRSDGPLEGDTRPKRGETAWPRTRCTAPRQRPTLLVVLCRRRADAEEARRRVEFLLQYLGLEAHPEKTRLVDLGWGKESFEFLGCRLRKRRSVRYPGRMFLQRTGSHSGAHRCAARRGERRARTHRPAEPRVAGLGELLSDRERHPEVQPDRPLRATTARAVSRSTPRLAEVSARSGRLLVVRLVLGARALSLVRNGTLSRRCACMTPRDHR